MANGAGFRQTRGVTILTRLAFPLLRRLDAERAHEVALLALRSGLVGSAPEPADPRLAVRWLGHALANPIGLAAGFDKDATCLASLARVGFGAIEAGTVTPLPQPGNPRPRLFRLAEDGAVINRMGFNNGGIDRFARRLRAAPAGVPVGANIGPNREGADPARDFPRLVASVTGLAAWVTLNVSSPNTPRLRDWQAPDRLAAILRAILAAVPTHPPLLVKLAPDLEDGALEAVVAACIEGGASGLVVSNTTTARPAGLRGRHAGEAGGLSGRPLFAASTAMLARVARLAAGRLALVGAGGVTSGADVLAKLRAGAGLVQLYTAFALEGPGLLPRLQREILAELPRQGFPDIQAAIGADL